MMKKISSLMEDNVMDQAGCFKNTKAFPQPDPNSYQRFVDSSSLALRKKTGDFVTLFKEVGF